MNFIVTTAQLHIVPSYTLLCALFYVLCCRCENSLGNAPAEIHCLLEAAHSFVAAERQSTDLFCPSYQENFTAAINCYEHAIKVCRWPNGSMVFLSHTISWSGT